MGTSGASEAPTPIRSKLVTTQLVVGLGIGLTAGILFGLGLEGSSDSDTVGESELRQVQIDSAPTAVSHAPRRHDDLGSNSGGAVQVVNLDGGIPLAEPDTSTQTVAAAAVVRSLLHRLHAEEISPPYNELPPEAAANVMNPYLDGMIDLLQRLPESYQVEMSREIETALCDPSASEARQLMLLRASRTLPSLATRGGVNCVLQSLQSEGIILATAIDVWNANDFEPTEEWQRRRAQLSDEWRDRFDGVAMRRSREPVQGENLP